MEHDDDRDCLLEFDTEFEVPVSRRDYNQKIRLAQRLHLAHIYARLVALERNTAVVLKWKILLYGFGAAMGALVMILNISPTLLKMIGALK